MALDPQNQNNFDMSKRQLGFAYWFVTHKILLKKIALAAGFVISSLFLLYGVYGFVDYFLITGPKEKQMLAQLPKMLVDFRVIHQKAARGLEILSAHLVPSSGKYDLVAKMRNPNDKWRASFDYYFLIDGRPTDLKTGFILPKEDKFIFELAYAAQSPKSLSFVIDKVRWQKLDPHKISNYDSWKKLHFNFLVSDITFNGAVKVDSRVFSQAGFEVKNLSAYDFWQVDFKAVLYRGPVIAGANFVHTEQFRAADSRDMAVTWYEPIPGVTKIEVYPEVNIFNDSVYMK